MGKGKLKKSGENTKKAAGRARKNEKARAAQEAHDKAKRDAEDRDWARGEDKRSQNKAAQKAEREAAAAEKRAAKKAAMDADQVDLAAMKKKTRGKGKVAAKREARVDALSKALAEVETASASNIDDAIDILSKKKSSEDLDRHPERRAKAAYKAYEAKWLPILMNDNPGLRRTQLKQQIAKKWKKAKENPMNQESLPFNFKKGKSK